MTVPQDINDDEPGARERDLELEPETLEDLTPPSGQADAVKGGAETADYDACQTTTM